LVVLHRMGEQEHQSLKKSKEREKVGFRPSTPRNGGLICTGLTIKKKGPRLEKNCKKNAKKPGNRNLPCTNTQGEWEKKGGRNQQKKNCIKRSEMGTRQVKARKPASQKKGWGQIKREDEKGNRGRKKSSKQKAVCKGKRLQGKTIRTAVRPAQEKGWGPRMRSCKLGKVTNPLKNRRETSKLQVGQEKITNHEIKKKPKEAKTKAEMKTAGIERRGRNEKKEEAYPRTQFQEKDGTQAEKGIVCASPRTGRAWNQE